MASSRKVEQRGVDEVEESKHSNKGITSKLVAWKDHTSKIRGPSIACQSPWLGFQWWDRLVADRNFFIIGIFSTQGNWLKQRTILQSGQTSPALSEPRNLLPTATAPSSPGKSPPILKTCTQRPQECHKRRKPQPQNERSADAMVQTQEGFDSTRYSQSCTYI